MDIVASICMPNDAPVVGVNIGRQDSASRFAQLASCLQLQRCQAGVHTALRHQLGVGALLDQLAAV